MFNSFFELTSASDLQTQVSPFLQQMFMPLLHAIFEVLLLPAEENDQSAALEKQMLRRSYFAFLQTVTGSGMSEVIANQGKEFSFSKDSTMVILTYVLSK